jgi:drug/metabolite transporter (DMT)-like permease
VLAERFFGFELGRRQWVALVLVAVGMGFLAATTGSTDKHSDYSVPAIAAFEAAAFLLGAACALAYRVERLSEHEGVLLGATAGLLFGLSDVSIKAVTGHSGGLMAVVSPWALTALLAGIAAFYASARSLQIGDGVAVITATAAAANVLGIVGGIVVFGDPIGGDALMIAGRVGAFALVVVGVSVFPVPARAQQSVAEDAAEDAQEERRRGREQAADTKQRAGAVAGA